ncbi:chemoreceptor glutamine deamidase CheD [Glaciimonas sp. CA11.2]|uniref:chemoreceptor glutamine deamidase CheD n=1 Tax=unclassified Glaciimonas TaxID=2644401 RepID=UPI002AB3F7BF|nr:MULTISPECIES: chemoreceptor glutamine deamidase CheD [unclassified Glaciimonas]MDY7548750.1 chemoreceptor glutamine deamidase CheD [Glaciimonas sp. CA11.2]MEB0013911.1 chemoreceptor glutamine deamidase CheD [Glaciimonas sp. Cout2]MEB0083846.1 chemoreceptor glutamine deamidase CheD [Glaciimonas sp. Gout2]MEB0164702.1 chemoreceptor glutamine deamidase CheD [Glaciimonas sp. CA11.2]
MISAKMEPVASHHYFDREFQIEAVKLLPNQYYVTDKDMVLTTVLGSCVSACVHDSMAGIGGMNHFMLPEDGGANTRDATAAVSMNALQGMKSMHAMRYGAYAMEVLLNELLKAGARRDRLEAKVFGGGAVLANMTMLNIGDRNAEFVLRYLELNQIRLAAQDLRGQLPRRVNYFPRTGKVMVLKLRRHDDFVQVQKEERELVQVLARLP